MSEYTILNSHQWRKCHKETCCCSGNYVVLNHNQFIGEFNTEEEAEKFIIGTTLSVGTLERLNGRQQPENHPDTDLIAENDVVEISIGIEKIEPLINHPTGHTHCGVDYITGINPPDNFELKDKLNEVIENQNRIIDYLNEMVRK